MLPMDPGPRAGETKGVTALTNRRRIAALAATFVLTGSVAGLAVAQSVPKASHTSPVAGFVAAVAQNLGVTPARLTTAIQSAELARVQSLHAAGHLKTARLKSLTARITHRPLTMLTLRLKMRGRHRMRPAEMKGAATFLGMTPSALHADRKAGQSLAAIALKEGKTSSALVQAMLAPIEKHLSKEVTSGHLSSTRETAILNRETASLQRFVNAMPHPHPKA